MSSIFYLIEIQIFSALFLAYASLALPSWMLIKDGSIWQNRLPVPVTLYKVSSLKHAYADEVI